MSNIMQVILNQFENAMNQIPVGYGDKIEKLSTNYSGMTYNSPAQNPFMPPKEQYLTVNPNDSVITNYLLSELQGMLTSMIPKLTYIANKYETPEIAEKAAKYIDAYYCIDVYENYNVFEQSVITKALSILGVAATKSEITMYANYPQTIPEAYRPTVLKYQREYVVNHYVEGNNYYRSLQGLPPIQLIKGTNNPYYDENGDYVVDTTQCLKFKDILTPAQIEGDYPFINDYMEIDGKKVQVGDVYLYKLPKDIILRAQVAGLYDEILYNFPTKEWLKYLLGNNIEPYDSRMAKNFDILYMEKPENLILYQRFIGLYYQVKNFILDVIYDPSAYDIDGKLYDGYIGILITTLTVQRFFANYLVSEINKEFYDKGIIKMYFEAYQIPFYDEISLNFLSKIARDLDMLLLYKATDQVFFDIFELFDIKDTSIYKYYLCKKRKVDINGEPICLPEIPKPEFNASLEEVSEYEAQVQERLESMFDLCFVQVPFDTTTLSVELHNPSNIVSYEEVTSGDPLWGGNINKRKFLNELMSLNINFLESKYISMTSLYELSDVINTSSYFFNTLKSLKIYENWQIPLKSGNYNFFDVLVALFAGLSIICGYDGNIMDTTTKNLSVLGFNFDVDNQEIVDLINEFENWNNNWTNNPYVNYTENQLIPTQVLDGQNTANYQVTDFETPLDMWTFFTKQENLKQFVLNKRKNASNIREFNFYNNIYRASMTTLNNNSMFEITVNGETRVAKTYLEYLKYSDIELYAQIYKMDKTSASEFVDEVLMEIDSFFNQPIMMSIPSISLNSIKKFIFYLINIFKSYTVDLLGMDIKYKLDDINNYNVHLINEIDKEEITEEVSMSVGMGNEQLWYMTPINIPLSCNKPIIVGEDTGVIEIIMHKIDWLKLEDKFSKFNLTTTPHPLLVHLLDILTNYEVQSTEQSSITFSDSLNITRID